MSRAAFNDVRTSMGSREAHAHRPTLIYTLKARWRPLKPARRRATRRGRGTRTEDGKDGIDGKQKRQLRRSSHDERGGGMTME